MARIPEGNGLHRQAPKSDTNTEIFMIHLVTLSAAQGTQYRIIRGSMYCEFLYIYRVKAECADKIWARVLLNFNVILCVNYLSHVPPTQFPYKLN
jgi:hypothetical protein